MDRKPFELLLIVGLIASNFCLFKKILFNNYISMFLLNTKKYDINKNSTSMANKSTETIIFNKRIKDPPKQSLLKGIVQIYYEYCSNTSIHGVQYLGQKRPLKEKLFWCTVFIVSIYCCAILINNVYLKWNETPVIVSFSEKSTPVWNIPFPAITICSETKRIVKNEGVTYAEFYEGISALLQENTPLSTKNISSQELVEFVTLLQICNTQLIDEGVPVIFNEKIDFYDVLDRMVPEFKRHFVICKWLKFMGDCKELFVTTYTEEGICYTFNGLSPKDLFRENTYQYKRSFNQNDTLHNKIIGNRSLMWSLEGGYTEGSGIKTYPARVLGAGSRAGLFIALQNFIHEIDYACRGPVQGFKVLLHSPNDSPHVSKQFVRIPMGKEILIAVKPNMITTSAGIADYHPYRRQCFLESERHLKFFKTYTQGNCELECLANFTLSKCGCVKFSMPRTLDMPVCDESKIYCYDNAEDELLMREFTQGLKETSFNRRGQTDCNCMPACTSLVYNAEISQGNFDLEELLDSAGDTEYLEENKGAQMSRLSIYFKENQFITSKRSELYGVTDFLANCGGIFGLFMGVSFLSVVEMIYHFTLRMWSNMKRRIEE